MSNDDFPSHVSKAELEAVLDKQASDADSKAFARRVEAQEGFQQAKNQFDRAIDDAPQFHAREIDAAEAASALRTTQPQTRKGIPQDLVIPRNLVPTEPRMNVKIAPAPTPGDDAAAVTSSRGSSSTAIALACLAVAVVIAVVVFWGRGDSTESTGSAAPPTAGLDGLPTAVETTAVPPGDTAVPASAAPITTTPIAPSGDPPPATSSPTGSPKSSSTTTSPPATTHSAPVPTTTGDDPDGLVFKRKKPSP